MKTVNFLVPFSIGGVLRMLTVAAHDLSGVVFTKTGYDLGFNGSCRHQWSRDRRSKLLGCGFTG